MLKKHLTSFKLNKNLKRLEKEPLLEFSYQVFQNDIPRIEFIRQKSLMYIKKLQISMPSDLAVKIFTYEDHKLIDRIHSTKYRDLCFKLIHPPETQICHTLYMKRRVDIINKVAKEILDLIFDYQVTDDIEIGLKIYK